MERTSSRCSIGASLSRSCSKETSFRDETSYSRSERKLLKVRSGVPDIKTCCRSHEHSFIKSFRSSQKACHNIFNLHEKKKKKGLHVVSENLYRQCRKISLSLAPGHKLCSVCWRAVKEKIKQKNVTEDQEQAVSRTTSGSSSIGEEEITSGNGDGTESGPSQVVASPAHHVLVENLNETLTAFGESPVRLFKLRSASAASAKSAKVQTTLRKTLRRLLDHDAESSGSDEAGKNVDYTRAGKEILLQLKEKLHSSKSASDEVEVLSVVPKSWTLKQIMDFFGVSKRLARKSKAMVKEKGILSRPDRKPGRPLPQDIVDKVVSFYGSEDISREMPGAKDCLIVLENGERVKRQKRLILANLKEIFQSFKERYPEIDVGFSKFADLRPKNCVLAGASGTHSVCVCVIHQNFKLAFERAINKLQTQDDTEAVLKNYRDCLQLVTCANPTEKCCFSECGDCPGLEVLRQRIEKMFEDDFVENVKFKQWLTVDRCSMETIEKSADDFLETFIEMIPAVLKHDFISKKQAEKRENAKSTLTPDTVITIADFSENYSFVLQDAVQGFHWNNSQATVHPFAGYYLRRSPDERYSLSPLNFIIISDCLDHDTAAVYPFQQRLVPFLKEMVPELKKIIYYSDGAASQNKNRYNVVNLSYHERDFKIKAEWHFFATSHGKGPSDGSGGTIKREAARASLMRSTDNQIQTPTELYEYAKSSLPGLNVAFVPSEEITTSREHLKKRFSTAPAVPGIRSFHAILPESNRIVFKRFSLCEEEAYSFYLEELEMDDTRVDNPVETRATKRKRRYRSKEPF